MFEVNVYTCGHRVTLHFYFHRKRRHVFTLHDWRRGNDKHGSKSERARNGRWRHRESEKVQIADVRYASNRDLTETLSVRAQDLANQTGVPLPTFTAAISQMT